MHVLSNANIVALVAIGITAGAIFSALFYDWLCKKGIK